MNDDEQRARGRRNLVIALGLAAFVVIVFFVSIMKMRLTGSP